MKAHLAQEIIGRRLLSLITLVSGASNNFTQLLAADLPCTEEFNLHTHGARILFRCDVGPTIGMGHLMRCIALAEEFILRGTSVAFVADVDSNPWAADQLRRRRIPFVEPPTGAVDGWAEMVHRFQADIVVIDSYSLDNDLYKSIRGTGVVVVAIVDGDLRDRVADLYVDPNFGADLQNPPLPPSTLRLAGTQYVLIRDDILNARPASPDQGRRSGDPKVFAFFGGTDPNDAASFVAQVLVNTGRRFTATLVAATPEIAANIRSIQPMHGQALKTISPTSALAEHVMASDVVISAAGTSTWELMCLGAASGLLCVAENQRPAYERLVASELVVGLGILADLRGDIGAANEPVSRLLENRQLQSRLRVNAWSTVDGRGRARLVESCLGVVGQGRN